VNGSIEFENGEIVDLDDLVDAWLPFIDAIAAADPDATWEPWYPGELADHLYATCPGLNRGRRDFRPQVGRGAIDPEGSDVCGWCVRVWKARR